MYARGDTVPIVAGRTHLKAKYSFIVLLLASVGHKYPGLRVHLPSG